MRPPVSIVVPFFGSPDELKVLVDRLGVIEFDPADEVLIVWNARQPPPALESAQPIQFLHAPREQSSYYARNVGAAAATRDWLLFLDADCEPPSDLLSQYFPDVGWAENVALVAGQVVGKAGGTTAQRFATSRAYLDQRDTLNFRPLGYGQTANLLVRTSWWQKLDGFTEGIISAGDADLCWRAQLAGGQLRFREEAAVLHEHRETLASLLRQQEKYGRGNRWLHERFGPGLAPSVWPLLLHVLPKLVLALVQTARGRFEEAWFRCLDVLCVLAFLSGRFRTNAAQQL